MTIRLPFRNGLIALGAVAAVGAVAAPLVGAETSAARHHTAAAASSSKTVQVLDDYFKPDKLTVSRGTTVKWVWSDKNYDTHNVTLKSGPKGVKKSQLTSIDGTSGIMFKRKLTIPGTYHFYCTIHPTMMTMTVIVKR